MRGYGGEGRIRTTEGVCQQIYSLPRLTASVPPHGCTLIQRSPKNTRASGPSQAQNAPLAQKLNSERYLPIDKHRLLCYFWPHIRPGAVLEGLRSIRKNRPLIPPSTPPGPFCNSSVFEQRPTAIERSILLFRKEFLK